MSENPYAPPAVIEAPPKKEREKESDPILEAKLAWQLPIISLGLAGFLWIVGGAGSFLGFFMLTSVFGGGAFTAMALVRGVRTRSLEFGRHAIFGAVVTAVCGLAVLF